MVDYFPPAPQQQESESKSNFSFDSLLIWLQFQSISFRKALTVGQLKVNKFLQLGPATELTIASGVITVTGSYHRVDTQSDASSDDLDTINGGTDGDILVLRAINSLRTVVMKDGVDNLRLAGDFSLDHVGDTIMLIFYDSTWNELSRSGNAS